MANEQEVEVKFYLRDLAGLEKRLQALGAQLSQPRVRETNLRFDTPDGDLTRAKRVLRLRQDEQVRMTFKGPAAVREDVSVRQEIEFAVSDFEAARHLLEALGYVVSVMYEKYRRTYELDGLHVTLDEMPYGSFAEIEGSEVEGIQAAAARLGLDWGARVMESYLALFGRLQAATQLPGRDLTFDNLAGRQVLPESMGVRYAD